MPDGIILGHILIPDFVHLYKFIKQCGVTLDYHIRYVWQYDWTCRSGQVPCPWKISTLSACQWKTPASMNSIVRMTQLFFFFLFFLRLHAVTDMTPSVSVFSPYLSHLSTWWIASPTVPSLLHDRCGRRRSHRDFGCQPARAQPAAICQLSVTVITGGSRNKSES